MARELLSPSAEGEKIRKGSSNREEEERLRNLESAMKLHMLGFSDNKGLLKKRVERLAEKFENEELLKQLNDDDKRKLAWIKDELELNDLGRSGQKETTADVIKEACKVVNVQYEPSDTPSQTVRNISNAIVQ